MKLLGHMVKSMFNVLRNHQTVSPKWLHHFTFPPAMYRVPVSPQHGQHLTLSVFFMTAIVVGV